MEIGRLLQIIVNLAVASIPSYSREGGNPETGKRAPDFGISPE
jgi:hypothetical protein